MNPVLSAVLPVECCEDQLRSGLAELQAVGMEVPTWSPTSTRCTAVSDPSWPPIIFTLPLRPEP